RSVWPVRHEGTFSDKMSVGRNQRDAVLLGCFQDNGTGAENVGIRRGVSGLNINAIRVRSGFIELSKLIHFPTISGSMKEKPVILRPGCERFEMNPWPTGSFTIANTIGIVFVAGRSAAITGVVFATITSGDKLTS